MTEKSKTTKQRKTTGQQVTLKKRLLSWGSLKSGPDFGDWVQTGCGALQVKCLSPGQCQSTEDVPPRTSLPVYLPSGRAILYTSIAPTVGSSLPQDTQVCISHCCVPGAYTALKAFDPSFTLTRFCLRKLLLA